MLKDSNNNSNIQKFAEELSTLVDQPIGSDHIHPSADGRFYYIQAPQPNSPMLLHHYRGVYFVDMNPEDYRRIETGELSPHEYIYSANWLIGFFWGGGSMIKGGYYQPFDIVNRSEEAIRYMKILSCRGYRRSTGYMPDEDQCSKCSIKNCPFSEYKQGTWDNELEEYDPRIDFFKALCCRFENQFPGYTLRGFLCSSTVEDDTIVLYPRDHYSESEPFSFVAYASEETIRNLLIREVTPEDWNDFASQFTFMVKKVMSNQCSIATQENVRESFKEIDYAKKTKPRSYEVHEVEPSEKKGIIAKIVGWFKK